MRARRLRRALAALLAVAGLFVPFIVGVPTAYDGEPVFVAIPVEHVNTLIGTGTGAAIVGEINNFPGASVPFGMVQYSPDTVDNYAGYDYDNPHSTGFSMTHASVGCPAFGDISMLPTTTPLGSQPWSAWEEIAHDDTEVGVPGYYTVRFPGTGVIAELTATTRTGVGRFRYPRNGWPALFHVRSGASLAGNYAATLQIEDNTTITGSATSGGFCGKKNLYTVYFAMKFSQPFSSYGTWDGYAVYPGSHSMNSSYSGGYVGFPAGSVLEVRTALSYVSVDGARANLDAEGGASFDDIRAATSSEWNAALSRIAVAGRGPGDVDTFYTCLYRSLLHPNTFNDVDGRYIGFDGVIHSVASGQTAASAAPPSFGAGSSAVTVNIARPIIGIVPGATGTVTVDAQRMIDGVDDYTVTPTSYVVGIAAEPLSGQFDDDGAVSASVAITVARSVPSGYYPIYVTTSAGDSARTLIVLVVVAEAVE